MKSARYLVSRVALVFSREKLSLDFISIAGKYTSDSMKADVGLESLHFVGGGMAYVDLNPVQGRMVDRSERSRQAGIRVRIVAQCLRGFGCDNSGRKRVG